MLRPSMHFSSQFWRKKLKATNNCQNSGKEKKCIHDLNFHFDNDFIFYVIQLSLEAMININYR